MWQTPQIYKKRLRAHGQVVIISATESPASIPGPIKSGPMFPMPRFGCDNKLIT